jgi:hypothetical protein
MENGNFVEEYKLYIKYPKWLFISFIAAYSILSIFTLWNIIFILKNISDSSRSEIIFSLISIPILIFIQIIGWNVIVICGFQNKYYCVINKDGIYTNEGNLLKKHLSWENELYYCITNSYIGLYKLKMLPLEGEIINEKNIKDGYISIKSKKALRKWYNNKRWIVMQTKSLKNNIQINDIINMINKSRENK